MSEISSYQKSIAICAQTYAIIDRKLGKNDVPQATSKVKGGTFVDNGHVSIIVTLSGNLGVKN